MSFWKTNEFHKVKGKVISVAVIEISSDEDLFLCFEFCSTSYLGTHTTQQRRDYTKQIFDFYHKNFPGISIYKDQNLKLSWSHGP